MYINRPLNGVLSAFTLAEMMVVMLILSIIMAAMAPVMTTRNKIDQSSPWQWAPNGTDAYYGIGASQVAMIGQHTAAQDDLNSRLIVNASGSNNHILFKNGNNTLGALNLNGNNLLLGSLREANSPHADDNVSVGFNIQQTGTGSVVLGSSASTNTPHTVVIGNSSSAIRENAVSIGYNSNAEAVNSIGIGPSVRTSGDNGIAIGNNVRVEENSIVIGRNSNTQVGHDSILLGNDISRYSSYMTIIGLHDGSAKSVYGEYSVSIGYNTTMSNNSSYPSEGAIAIGNKARAMRERAINLGYNADYTYGAEMPDSIAIGSSVSSVHSNSIAIGTNAIAGNTNLPNTVATVSEIAIGLNSKAYLPRSIAIGEAAQTGTQSSQKINSIAIGHRANALGSYSVSLGQDATTANDNSIAIGSAEARGEDSIAIGTGAFAEMNNNIAIGTNACENVGAYSNVVCIGPDSGPDDEKQKGSNRMYLGNPDTIVYLPGHLVVGGAVVLNAKLNYGSTILRAGNNRGGAYGIIRSDNMDGDDDNLRNAWDKDASQFERELMSKFEINMSSDRRLKYVGKASTSGLDKIRQLKVFNYTFKKDEKKTPHVGVIAQDLQKVFPDAVKKGVDGFLTIRFEDMFFAMINAIKELDSRITALEKENQELKEQNKQLDARLKIIEAKLK